MESFKLTLKNRPLVNMITKVRPQHSIVHINVVRNVN